MDERVVMDDPVRSRSVGESQHLMLARPSDQGIERPGDADARGQSTFDSGFDESRREEGERIVI
jgi:hypothetical protein